MSEHAGNFPLRTQAWLNRGPGSEFELADVDIEGIRADELLVRIVATGLCHTDLSVRDTMPPEMFPRVFGHEGAGVVEAIGADVEGYSIGDQVVLSFRACRTCRHCVELGVGYCENTVVLNYMGFRLDGSTTLTSGGDPLQASFFGQSSFARHAVVSPDNAVRVAADADLTRLGPFGCAFQTGAGAVLHVLEPGTDDALVVYGVGAVGLTAIATAKARGVGTVVAVDLKPERLSAAAELGADTLNPADLEGAGLADRIRELTGGGASHALDTTGVATVIRDAGLALRPRGTLVVLGLGDAEISLDAVDLMMNGKVVRGSVEGDGDPHQVIPELIRMAQEGSLPVDGFITTYLFAEINQAAADLLSGAAIKPVLVWE